MAPRLPRTSRSSQGQLGRFIVDIEALVGRARLEVVRGVEGNSINVQQAMAALSRRGWRWLAHHRHDEARDAGGS